MGKRVKVGREEKKERKDIQAEIEHGEEKEEEKNEGRSDGKHLTLPSSLCNLPAIVLYPPQTPPPWHHPGNVAVRLMLLGTTPRWCFASVDTEHCVTPYKRGQLNVRPHLHQHTHSDTLALHEESSAFFFSHPRIFFFFTIYLFIRGDL